MQNHPGVAHEEEVTTLEATDEVLAVRREERHADTSEMPVENTTRREKPEQQESTAKRQGLQRGIEGIHPSRIDRGVVLSYGMTHRPTPISHTAPPRQSFELLQDDMHMPVARSHANSPQFRSPSEDLLMFSAEHLGWSACD